MTFFFKTCRATGRSPAKNNNSIITDLRDKNVLLLFIVIVGIDIVLALLLVCYPEDESPFWDKIAW